MHHYVIYTVLFIIVVLLIIQLTTTYRMKSGPSVDHTQIHRMFQQSAQNSITADELMRTKDPAQLQQAAKLVYLASSQIDTLLSLFSVSQLEEIVQVSNVDAYLRSLQEQSDQINCQIQNLAPSLFAPHRAHRHFLQSHLSTESAKVASS